MYKRQLDRNVKGIICGNDDLASQAFRALSEERLAGKVCVTGQDGDLAACQRIVEETQEMTAFKSVEQEASQMCIRDRIYPSRPEIRRLLLSWVQMEQGKPQH